MNTKEKIMQIMSLALDINPPEIKDVGQKTTAVFVFWCPHVNKLQIDVHENGWEYDVGASFSFDIDMDDEHAPADLDEAIRALEEIKTEVCKNGNYN